MSTPRRGCDEEDRSPGHSRIDTCGVATAPTLRGMPELPLFPLGSVLLPGAPLALRVFEPRYLALLHDLGDRPPQERAFGVVAIRRGHEVGTRVQPVLATHGTAARITEISPGPPGPGGATFHVAAVGGDRFVLESLRTAEGGYYVGEVTWLEDLPADPDSVARAEEEMREAYRDFLLSVGAPPGVPDLEGERLAYEIMSTVALPLTDRQQVLAENDPVVRLSLVTRLLRREAVLFGGLRLMPAETRSFGVPSQN